MLFSEYRKLVVYPKTLNKAVSLLHNMRVFDADLNFHINITVWWHFLLYLSGVKLSLGVIQQVVPEYVSTQWTMLVV